ncbi:hypothetical protein J5N97_022926 [Dioscorea zingiberensis]|uniref:Uncharacterized protein n=1 Tax=Dioscorea zingiberensis TaxID=325984 RepID=A0A9D5CBN9_9LILI|nr:hypothetical protein J5N97_022926 [Dioscorea zingiberensis]
MASSPIPALKVLEQSTVSPPISSVPETSIPLSFSDLMCLNLNNVERIFFYSIPHFIKHLLPSLKTSLSLTLQHFFPLAGHVIFSPNSDGGKFQYQYKDGRLHLLQSPLKSDRGLHATWPRRRALTIELESLVPALAAGSADATPLMAMQVTVFPSQGICLSLTINHGACDGTSAANFLKSWAATCKSGAASAVLSTMEFSKGGFQRKGGSPLLNVCSSLCLHVDVPSPGKRVAEKPSCMVGFSGERKGSSSAGGARGILRQSFWDFWRSNAEVGELVKEDGLRAAAEILGRVIDGLGDGVLRDVVDAWVEMGKIVKDERPLLVLGSPGFRFYDSDFGWGRPVKVEVVSLKNTGAMSISEGKGGGGIGIGLAAPKMEMERFSFEFAQGLHQLLHSF